MSAPAKSSDLADAYGLLLEQDRALDGLCAVLQTLMSTQQPGEHPHKGLLSAAQFLAMSARDLCQFTQGELESLASARQAAAEVPNA